MNSSGTDGKVQHAGGHQHHHILSYQAIAAVGAVLFILTGLTVWVAGIDLGKVNFLVALLIATIKGSLVALIFMNLRYDRRENGAIFSTAFLFLAIFITLTSTDLFFRGNVYLKPGQLLGGLKGPKSTLKDPWIATPQLIAHGKELFMENCVTCHGATGQGNGIAASGLNPRPRNFTQDKGWVNGRLPSDVFKTLRQGVPGSAMASFATLPADDRWALVQYVLSLGPPHPQDTPDTLAKIGYGPKAPAGGGRRETPTIPVYFALERMAQAVPEAAPAASEGAPVPENELDRQREASASGMTAVEATTGPEIYQMRCAGCHGVHGEGGIRVLAFGLNPRAYMTTRPFNAASSALSSAAGFNQMVINGLPGRSMPGYGQLTTEELNELYGYVRSLTQKSTVAR